MIAQHYWLCRDEDGEFVMFNCKPKRGTRGWYYEQSGGIKTKFVLGLLPEELISEDLRTMTWNDNPIEVTFTITKKL